MFKDGNKQNFDPSNLELISRREMSARGFVGFASFPESLQLAIRQAGRLCREIRRKKLGEKTEPGLQSKRKNSGGRLTAWTEALDDQLRRGYPRLPIRQLMASLKVTEPSLRNRAKRLKVHRLRKRSLVRHASHGCSSSRRCRQCQVSSRSTKSWAKKCATCAQIGEAGTCKCTCQRRADDDRRRQVSAALLHSIRHRFTMMMRSI